MSNKSMTTMCRHAVFVQRLCKEELHSASEIVATYCGHVFHQICLDKHIENVSTCPTCKKSLRVNMALLATLSHDMATLPLHLEKCSAKATNCENPRLANENMILKQKILELSQAIIILQEEKRNVQTSEVIYNNMFPIIGNNVNSLGENIAGNTSKHQPLANKISICNSGHSSDSLITPWMDALKTLSESERDRLLRSKRRECLTWRNKAQTWLSKMKTASDKLLRAEACFKEQEYLEQLLLFYNKLSLQGEIIETAKKASLIYLIIGDTSEAEKEAVQVSMQHIFSGYEEIMMKVINRLHKLNIQCGRLLSPRMAMINIRAKREYPNLVLSSNNTSSRFDADLTDWITNEVSTHPKARTTKPFSTMNLHLPLDVEYSFDEPIYV